MAVWPAGPCCATMSSAKAAIDLWMKNLGSGEPAVLDSRGCCGMQLGVRVGGGGASYLG